MITEQLEYPYYLKTPTMLLAEIRSRKSVMLVLELSCNQGAKMFGVNRATISRWRTEINRWLKET